LVSSENDLGPSDLLSGAIFHLAWAPQRALNKSPEMMCPALSPLPLCLVSFRSLWPEWGQTGRNECAILVSWLREASPKTGACTPTSGCPLSTGMPRGVPTESSASVDRRPLKQDDGRPEVRRRVVARAEVGKMSQYGFRPLPLPLKRKAEEPL